MSRDSNRGPTRLIPGRPPTDPAECQAWFRQTFGEMPAPTADMDPQSELDVELRRREAMAALERSLPAGYRWATFKAPELAALVGSLSDWALRNAIWRQPKVIFMGPARAGKTSLAVACLRRWVARTGRAAGFFHAYQLGVARIQHPAGHGEPEIVDHAMKFPMALLDDVGMERDMGGNAMADVIFARHAEDRPLWVTTGSTRPQLDQRYGAGIVGRLFEKALVVRLGEAVA